VCHLLEVLKEPHSVAQVINCLVWPILTVCILSTLYAYHFMPLTQQSCLHAKSFLVSDHVALFHLGGCFQQCLRRFGADCLNLAF
jgi:hypothetical protein